MSSKPAVIVTGEGLAMVIDNRPYECSSDHPEYENILKAVQNEEWDIIPGLISARTAIKEMVHETGGIIEVHDDYISYNGEIVHGSLVNRILMMRREGFNIEPMLNFMTNLYQNPSKMAVNELYDFLVKAKLPITEDGHFLAYKRVNYNYTSCHDGKTDNSIGTTLWMPREDVDPNRHNTCSTGFHFCSFDYLRNFNGSRTVIVKINPKDVVSIPSDYDYTKGRACSYYVEGEVDNDDTRNVLGEARSVVKSSAEVPTAEKYENEATPPSGLSDVVEELTIEDAEVYGYDAGYRCGRYGHEQPSPPEGEIAFIWKASFDEGVQDGKKHKARKHKAPKKA